eukprot:16043_1
MAANIIDVDDTSSLAQLPQLPRYVPTFGKYGDKDINENGNCPAMYNRSWSDTLIDVINNYCRHNDILTQLNQNIPTVVFETIALFYANDITHRRSYQDYVHALLICKYFSKLKETPGSELNANENAIKSKYKLTKKAALTTTKVMKALNDYKKPNSFRINNGDNMEELEIIFVDHVHNKLNLKKYSYPKGIAYKISQDELDIITAVRDTIELNRKHPVRIRGRIQEYHRSNELVGIVQDQYFKTDKTSIETHIIMNYSNKAIFAIDSNNVFAYFMFVFKFFTIIIHDKLYGDRHTTRTMQARAIASKYRGVLEQFDKSGL